ncbi:MAG: 4-hydroxybenzoate 3-monooxygenase [Betaproteobacteria bacterium RIFCSPLOWO2_02_FULL_62_17]|nr:MAG: 4-hydroxybenzoate 3-monooxygenase [Betaproteobacteria bacterium RIFCSPLOWO2_02_FULL_62_17]
MSEPTQVAIVGAGPAGLVLSHLLHLQGIESVILESRSREYVEKRIRAGLLEQRTVDLLISTGVGERLKREAMVHTGLNFQFEGERHRIPLDELTPGRNVTIYGQQEVVKDLIAARLAAGGVIHFEAAVESIQGLEGSRPVVRYRQNGTLVELEADYVAGCDGFHGVCRGAVANPKVYEKVYPFAWLGILAQVAPSCDELIYARHERGFALHTMRTPKLTRLYLQCPVEDSIEQWSDDRIWSELRTRLNIPGWSLADGPVVDKGITEMRSFVHEPMQHGRLFLAGDSAHIVPPTGAKGMNLAISDARVLAAAFIAHYKSGNQQLLERYTADCLPRVWRAQHFSWWWTTLFHRFEDEDAAFQQQLQVSQLRYMLSSRPALTSMAENYVGLERVV